MPSKYPPLLPIPSDLKPLVPYRSYSFTPSPEQVCNVKKKSRNRKKKKKNPSTYPIAKAKAVEATCNVISIAIESPPRFPKPPKSRAVWIKADDLRAYKSQFSKISHGPIIWSSLGVETFPSYKPKRHIDPGPTLVQK